MYVFTSTIFNNTLQNSDEISCWRLLMLLVVSSDLTIMLLVQVFNLRKGVAIVKIWDE